MSSFILTLTFNSRINTSAQEGDMVYWTPTFVKGGFDTATTAGTIELGPIYSENTSIPAIENPQLLDGPTSTIRILCPHTLANGAANTELIPHSGEFITFAKNKLVNTSSLVGYYARVKLVNDSNEKAELFSIGSEIFESSK